MASVSFSFFFFFFFFLFFFLYLWCYSQVQPKVALPLRMVLKYFWFVLSFKNKSWNNLYLSLSISLSPPIFGCHFAFVHTKFFAIWCQTKFLGICMHVGSTRLCLRECLCISCCQVLTGRTLREREGARAPGFWKEGGAMLYWIQKIKKTNNLSVFYSRF